MIDTADAAQALRAYIESMMPRSPADSRFVSMETIALMNIASRLEELEGESKKMQKQINELQEKFR